MSDHTAGDHGESHTTRTPHAEFYVYFAIIFVLAIPFAMAIWVLQLVRERRLPVHGPLARAWREAGTVTPAIFRA